MSTDLMPSVNITSRQIKLCVQKLVECRRLETPVKIDGYWNGLGSLVMGCSITSSFSLGALSH